MTRRAASEHGKILAGMAGAVAASLPAVQADATPVTISETINFGALLQAGGGSLSGTFNINPLVLAPTTAPYTILSGSLSVFGFSDISYTQTSNSNYSTYYTTGYSYRQTAAAYTYTSFTGYYCYYSWGQVCNPNYTTTYVPATYAQDIYLQQDHDVNHIDVLDVVQIAADGTSATGQDGLTTGSTGPYGSPSYSFGGGDYYYGYEYFYDRSRDTYSAISGPITASGALDPTAIANLGADGLLPFDISVLAGQSGIDHATLTVTYDTAELVAADEPGAAGILAAALGGLALATRNRRRISPRL